MGLIFSIFAYFVALFFSKFQRFRSKSRSFRSKAIRFCLILKDMGRNLNMMCARDLRFWVEISKNETKSQRFWVDITNISVQNNKHLGTKSQTFRLEISNISEEFGVNISMTLWSKS